jgi:hypothetical protein
MNSATAFLAVAELAGPAAELAGPAAELEELRSWAVSLRLLSAPAPMSYSV